MKDILIVKLYIIFSFCCLVIFGLSINSAFAEGNKIAIVHSYSPTMSWVINLGDGVKKVLGDKYEYEEIFMDTKRIDKSKFKEVAEATLNKLESIKPRLVIVSDDNALKLVGRYIDAETPVVFAGINASLRDDYPWLFEKDNMTGILERPLIKRNLQETMEAFGLESKKILVLMDDSLTAQYFFKLDLDSKDTFSVMGAQVNVFKSGDFSDWQRKILSTKDDGYNLLLLAGAFALRDEKGNSISAIDVAKWISNNSPIPPFTTHLQQIGEGLLVGGLQLSGRIMGEDAAKIAKQILDNNIKPKSIFPQRQSAGDLKYSKAEIKKQGLTLTPKYQKLVIFVD